MVKELLELTISGNLNPIIRRRLADVVQLIQFYCRLAELEIAAGERPRVGDVALPEDMGGRIKGWAEDEETKARAGQDLAEELGQVMQAHGHDPTPIREVVGG